MMQEYRRIGAFFSGKTVEEVKQLVDEKISGDGNSEGCHKVIAHPGRSTRR